MKDTEEREKTATLHISGCRDTTKLEKGKGEFVCWDGQGRSSRLTRNNQNANTPKDSKRQGSTVKERRVETIFQTAPGQGGFSRILA